MMCLCSDSVTCNQIINNQCNDGSQPMSQPMFQPMFQPMCQPIHYYISLPPTPTSPIVRSPDNIPLEPLRPGLGGPIVNRPTYLPHGIINCKKALVEKSLTCLC